MLILSVSIGSIVFSTAGRRGNFTTHTALWNHVPIPDDVFVADAVAHAYNLPPSNYAVERYAEPVIDRMLGVERSMPGEYRRTEELMSDRAQARREAVMAEHRAPVSRRCRVTGWAAGWWPSGCDPFPC